MPLEDQLSAPLPLPVRDRRTGRTFEEFMDDSPATYESKPHRSLAQQLQSHPALDWLIAAYQHTRLSARKIAPFVRKHRIDMSEFKPGPYRSYAEFFEREFLPGKRSFPQEPGQMGAFAEARYFAWNILRPDMELPIKGHSVRPDMLLGDAAMARDFAGGPVILARLAPVDYHHLHYFDDGRTVDDHRLVHRLWTINRHALLNKDDILFRNERRVQILDTEHFGRVAFVEIGALSVGRIVQKHDIGQPFRRGEEKSVFRFGGSAVVVLGEPGRWQPADDILRNTREGTETFVRLGEPISHAPGLPPLGATAGGAAPPTP